MLKIAIVEDDKEYAAELQKYLRRYESEYGQAFKITVFSDGDEIVRNYQSDYDIILMDIEMTFMDGMSAAEEIREVDKEVTIIFITNMAQYAIKGYAVNALDYVLKPISYFAFSQTIMRAIERLDRKKKKYITFSVKTGSVRLAIDDISYIESIGHTLIIHTKSRDYEMLGSLKKMEEELKDDYFFRSNRGYLVNMANVESIEENEVVVNGKYLLISRMRKKEFMSALTSYWGNLVR